MGLGLCSSGLGEGQLGLTGYRVGGWGSAGCVGACVVGFWGWGGLFRSWVGLGDVVLGLRGWFRAWQDGFGV